MDEIRLSSNSFVQVLKSRTVTDGVVYYIMSHKENSEQQGAIGCRKHFKMHARS